MMGAGLLPGAWRLILVPNSDGESVENQVHSRAGREERLLAFQLNEQDRAGPFAGSDLQPPASEKRECSVAGRDP